MNLWISHKTYSSWSLRPWMLLKQLGIDFQEHQVLFGDGPAWDRYRQTVGSGKVPALNTSDGWLWDSMAITEWLAERHEGVWPQAPEARAWARCAAAEMHSGFQALRQQCAMHTLARFKLHDMNAALCNDLARVQALWEEGLARFGGPFLAGDRFTAVDAFFCPVAWRIWAYQLPISAQAQRYADQLLALPAMQQWQQDALREPADPPHEADCTKAATCVLDLRAGLA